MRAVPVFAAACTTALILSGCTSDGAAPAQGVGGPSRGSEQAAAAPGPTSTPPPCQVPAKFRNQELTRLPVDDKVIALTFDAGANADGVPSIRATLRKKNVRKATFFLTGRFVESHPVKSARIARDHLVGNHTNTHPDLTELTDRAVRRQVRHAQRTILDGTGEDPRRFLRFPYGASDAHTIALVNNLCYVPFRWTVDTLGWKGTSGGMTAEKVVARVLDAATPGAIVLMHVGSNPDDGTTLDADALPEVIHALRDLGYRFARLSLVMSAAP